MASSRRPGRERMERISCQLIRKEKLMNPLFILGMINAAEFAIVLVILLIVLNWDKFK